MNILIKAMILAFTTFAAMHPSEKPASYFDELSMSGPTGEENSPLKNVLIGAAAGLSDITITQPFVRIRNCYIFKVPIKLTPPFLYKGFLANIISTLPTNGIQVMSDELIYKKISSKTFSSLLGGSLSGLIACPTEVIMLTQQTHNLNLIKTSTKLHNQNGLKAFFRGFTPVAARDAIYTFGYIQLSPLIAEAIFKKLNLKFKNQKNGELSKSIIGGIPAGILVSIATQPLDVIRAKMQIEAPLDKYSSMAKIIKNIYNEDHIKGFFKSGASRGMSIIIGIPIMNYVTTQLKNI